MDEIRCSIRLAEEAEGRPPRLVGVLMPYGERAQDRAEVFEPGSLSWPESGVVLRRQHERSQPILRFTPVEVEGRLTVDAPIPDTVAGRDALAEIRSGLFRGLSVEFRAVRQTIVLGVRRISEAILTAAGLVDEGSFAGAVVEARLKSERELEEEWERWKREMVL